MGRKKAQPTQKLSPKPKGLSAAESKAYDEALEQSARSDSWKPEAPGETLIAKLVGRRTIDTQNGQCDVVDLETKDRGVLGLILGTVLAKEFERVKPKVGNSLVIIYRGTYDSGKKGRSPARLFSVAKIGKK